jgi:hypothetical protein
MPIVLVTSRFAIRGGCARAYGILSRMKTALRALLLVAVASGIAGIYLMFAPDHSAAPQTTALSLARLGATS